MSHAGMKPDNYTRFLSTRSGRSLLEKYSLDQVGVWKVLGEDPNCDFGGHHHMPELGVYEGKLRDIISMAVEMSGFWQWGAGGDIKLVSIKKVSAEYNRRQAELISRRDALKKELEKIERDLE